jgi:hypothetical protein
MKKYKRPPSVKALRHRFAKFGDDKVETTLLRLLSGGKLAVTNGAFWLRKAALE